MASPRLDLAEGRLCPDRFWSMTVLDHALNPRHDIGKQRASAVPALIVHVPDWDELGNPFVRRDAGQEKRNQIRREGRPPRPLCRIPDGRGGHPAVSVCRHPAADRGTAAHHRQPHRRELFDPREFAQTRSERYVSMPTKSPLSGARRADLTGFCVHRREGSALPKSVERGNLTLDKAVIRWTGSGGRGGARPQPCRR